MEVRSLLEQPRIHRFCSALSSSCRVLLLGGLAVIGYGHSRGTKDVDLWVEPFSTPQAWTDEILRLLQFLGETSHITVLEIGTWKKLAADEIASSIDSYGVIRIMGFEIPVDLFRRPNEMETNDFEEVWSRSQVLHEGLKLPEKLDLLITKSNTARASDSKDTAFLDEMVRKEYAEILPRCGLEEATKKLYRYADPQVLEVALKNPDEQVQALAVTLLHEFAGEGDPFSTDILAAYQKNHATP